MNVLSLDPRANRLLRALPEEELRRWRPRLQPANLPAGKVLGESGAVVEHMIFPTTAIASLLYVTEGGASAEFAVVGNEGALGIAAILGGGSMPHRVVVQAAGLGYRVDANVMRTEFERSAPARHLMLRYTQALVTQMAQTAVCNRLHTLEQQLCRWLLMRLDRLPGDTVLVTQASIASMLGVRRESVTEAAVRLQQAGTIRYARGRISVLDRHGLETRACECYSTVTREYRRLLPDLTVA